MQTGTFDSHRGLPFENLRTNVTLVNKDAVPGGAFDAGPLFGTRTVHWGIDVLNGESLCIDVTDVAPRSLTAGITGLEETGSRLRGVPSNAYFLGDLESRRLAFGVDLESSPTCSSSSARRFRSSTTDQHTALLVGSGVLRPIAVVHAGQAPSSALNASHTCIGNR